MKVKALILAALLLISANAMAQYPVHETIQRHGSEQTVSLQIVAGSTDSIVVQFPGSNTGYQRVQVDTLILGGSVSTYWDAAASVGDILWDGRLSIQIAITNDDLQVDSLETEVYAIDRDGNVSANKKVWCNWGVAGSYGTSEAAYAWTSTSHYFADLTDAFGEGTAGVLIVINPNDAAGGGETGVATVDITAK